MSVWIQNRIRFLCSLFCCFSSSSFSCSVDKEFSCETTQLNSSPIQRSHSSSEFSLLLPRLQIPSSVDGTEEEEEERGGSGSIDPQKRRRATHLKRSAELLRTLRLKQTGTQKQQQSNNSFHLILENYCQFPRRRSCLRDHIGCDHW